MTNPTLKEKILENIIVTPKKRRLSVASKKEQSKELLKTVLIQTTHQTNK